MVILMTNEKLNDALSAMMDEKADELEVRRVLAAEDEEVLATWSRYQMASSILRKEAVFPKLNIASAVSDAVAAEDSSPRTEAVNQKKGLVFFSGLDKVAVAASILMVTISTVYLFNNENFSDTATSVYAQNKVSIDGVATTNDVAVDKKVSELIKRHDKQGALTVEGRKYN